MIEDCTALVFAGGDSRRMGVDKASLRIGGQSLLQRTLELTRTLFPVTLISVRHLRADIGAPQVCDEVPGAGPLAGLCAGLRQARTPWIFAVATDMPYLLPAVVEHMASMRGAHQAVVPVIDDHTQSLTAFYAATALPAFQAALTGGGKHSLRAVLAELDVRQVGADDLRRVDADLRSFTDLDTPEDVAMAHRYFGDPTS